MSNVDKYLEVVPSERQLIVQKMGFYAFIHFGINTFTNSEWGDGKADPIRFNPEHLDTDQWARVIAGAGMKGIIFTAKHHDGFCLYPSKYTEYSIKNSPYKEGKGDIVKELMESCKKYNLKLGIYLSPWDRNQPTYGTEKYDDFYVSQLEELLTGYGEIFCIWMDGACGAAADGKIKQIYDFDRYYKVIRELQPQCLISNCGPDIRWVGNESGMARESEWNVVPEFVSDQQAIAENSQQDDSKEFRKQGVDVVSSDLGSRKFLSNFKRFMWYPAEVDVSIRPGWFYHKKEDKKVRSPENILNIYLNSVGGNSLLLLNIPPDKRGLIADADIKSLVGFKERLDTLFALPIKVISAKTDGEKNVISLLKGDEYEEIPLRENGIAEIIFGFDAPVYCDKVILREDTRFSQRVESFELFISMNGKRKKVYSGTIIGFNKIVFFKKTMGDSIILKITSCRKNPHLEYFTPFSPSGNPPSKPKFLKIKRKLHEWNYKIYVKKMAKKAIEV